MMNLRNVCLSLVMCAILATASVATAEPTNVILMISDGLGMNGWAASSYYLYEQTNTEWHANLPYGTQNGFDMYGCTHYMLNGDGTPQGYDPNAMWADFNYTKGDNDYKAFTDSAAAATALYTGTKTYKGAVGVDFDRNPLTSIAQIAEFQGKATGAISSVQMSHATPAAVYAHNVSRNNYAAIANEMIYNSGAEVIMGAGHPNAQDDPNKYVGGVSTWNDMQDGEVNGMTFIDDVADFQALANGTMTPPSKLIGIAEAPYTLMNGYNPPLPNDESVVPTLATMTKGALKVLERDEDGFFLMVEGGAVDWENHANAIRTMLNEQEDFDNSVAEVISWIEDGSNDSSWDNTLLIVTADHECGMMWPKGLWDDLDDDGFYTDGNDVFNGFDANTVKGMDNGMGVLPGVGYSSGGHTNQLVPLFAKGKGAEGFAGLVDMDDPNAQSYWQLPTDDVVDNTDVFTVMESTVPEPATMSLLALGGLGALIRRRK